MRRNLKAESKIRNRYTITSNSGKQYNVIEEFLKMDINGNSTKRLLINSLDSFNVYVYTFKGTMTVANVANFINENEKELY